MLDLWDMLDSWDTVLDGHTVGHEYLRTARCGHFLVTLTTGAVGTHPEV